MRPFVLFLNLVIAAPCLAAGPVLYVSPAGNDAWSGRRAEANATKDDGPFATLTRARDELRALRKQAPLSEGATVVLRGGTYYLTEPFALTGEDSGTAEAPVVYRNQEGETPVLVGGLPIKAFTPYRDGIYKAAVAEQGFREVYFRSLYYRGQRQTLARYPNAVPDAPICGGWSFLPGDPPPMYGQPTEETVEDRRTIHVRPEDIHDWAKPAEGEVFVLPKHNWWNHIVGIESVDRANGIIRLKPDSGFEGRLGDRRFGMKPGCRYYVRNLFGDLDAPGEWYLDQADNTLYFYPPGPLEDGDVVAPRVTRVITLGDGASHLRIQGLTIEVAQLCGVELRGAQDCVVAGCTIRNLTDRPYYNGAGVYLDGTGNGVVGCDISQLGSSGIVLTGGDSETLEPAGNYADNNYIHHIGIDLKSASGISCDGVGNRVSHNLVHDTPRQGLRWHGSDQLIEYNEVHHTNTEISDTAGINACNTSWTKRGSVLRYNFVHDTLGFGMNHDGEWVSPYYCWGIYLDNYTCGTTVYGNICARIQLGGPYIHGGRDNLIENNYIIDCDTGQMQYSTWLPSGEDGKQRLIDELQKYARLPAYQKYPGLPAMLGTNYDAWIKMAGNRFVRNICSYSKPEARLYKQRGLDYESTQSDHNLIWHHGLPIHCDLPEAPADEQWAAWRKLGFEEHSVIADPGFVDPAHDDYRLKPDSPALKLGIKTIPVDQIGPYQDELRASWPIVEASGVREHPPRLELMPKPRIKQTWEQKPRPVFRVPRRTAPIPIDGQVGEDDWGQVDMRRGITFKYAPDGSEVKQRSYAFLAYDDEALYVGFRNHLTAELKGGTEWGQDTDAVEVALQVPNGETVVLRGFTDGSHVSSPEAGASSDTVTRADAVEYAAKVIAPNLWCAEWRIPFQALGAEAADDARFAINLTCRHAAADAWLMWQPTYGSSWMVDRAAVIELGRTE